MATGEHDVHSDEVPNRIIPLSERILATFGRPRALWLVLWGCVASCTYQVSSLHPAAAYPGLGFTVASAYLNILALWGVGNLAAGLNAIQPRIARMREGCPEETAVEPFRPVGSTAGPLLLVLGGTLLLFVVHLVRYPNAVTVATYPFLFVGWLPGACLVWVCFALFWGLDRLGRCPLRLTSFHQDRSLGLASVGKLANAAFLLLLAAIVPFAFFVGRDPMAVGLTFAYLVAGMVLFVMSSYRLHEQMVGTKRAYFAHVRSLHDQACAPAEADNWSLEALSAHAGRINAAEAFERRVASIHEWPIPDAVLAKSAAIATAIMTGIAVRLILHWI